MNEYSGNFDLNSVSSLPRWFGRVVSDVSWQENVESKLFSEAEQQKGWGYRYRVRYFGLHSGSTQDLSDEQLPMANVVMPVTAGSGLGGFYDTPALSSGSVVTGFFLDGMAGQEPYIDGVLINSNNEVPKEQPKDEIGGLQLFNQTYKEGSPETGAFVPTNLIGTQEYWKVIQSIGDKINLGDGAIQAWTEQDLDRKKPTPLASPCKTDNSPFKGIQTTIKNLLNDIQNYDTIAEIFGGGNPNREAFIQKILDIATGDIVGYVKNLFDSIRGYAYTVIADEAKKRMPFLFPSEIPEFTQKVNEGNNILSCLFNKLVRQLPNLIRNILSGLLDKLIDTAFCFVENFVSDLLSKFGILDQITNAVKTAISLFSQAVDILNSVGEFAFNGLDFVNGILNFFKCDDDAACPQQQEITLSGVFSQSGDPQVSFDKLIGPNPVFSYGSGNGSSSNQPDYSVAFK
jgi:hypothetical protein